jgi:acetyl/propionyl-CoA carboxylase alpha subunit
VPGTTGAASGPEELKEFARGAGYPVLLKASAGGGGKGMRRVDSESELDSAFARASSEARAFFSDGAVYAEKLIERPRHIEVQIIADTRGHAVAVGERECSLQRRHQKVLEECPSPAVGPDLRSRLFEAALAAARAAHYVSCGTVEFLLAPGGSFYFLEMNTRLQVEHPVTEEVFGVDLAAEMIRIALGEPLSFESGDLSARGHAIECRVYAEDPRRDFAPSPGAVTALRLPAGPGVRHDIGIEQGGSVPIDYDPMLGKLVVTGADRPRAIARLARALSEYEISGVETTLPLFRRLVEDPEFLAGAFDTQWLERRLAESFLDAPPPSSDDVLLAAISLSDGQPERAAAGAAPPSRWRSTARAEALRR